MADEKKRTVTRRDLPDEMPRSAVSGRRMPNPADGHGNAPTVVWLVLALLLVAVFVGLLWTLHPPGRLLGGSGAEIVVPKAPPPHAP
jgi:hypothetical protein